MDFSQLKEKINDVASALFKVGPTNLVGIDIGFSAVRVAELVGDLESGYKLLNFNYHELSEGCLIDDDIQRSSEIINAVKICFKEKSIKNLNVCIGVFGPNHTIFKKLDIPSGTPEEIEDQVLWEAEQYVPFGIDGSNISHFVMGTNEGGGVVVMVAAAKESLVSTFVEIATKADLTPRIVDLNVIAITNTYYLSVDERERTKLKNVLLIDFGAQFIKLMLLRENILIFTREINMGGITITEDIQRQMGLSYREAENLKIKGDEQGRLPEEIETIIKNNIENFTNEIKKTINFFMTATSHDAPIDACYISGGTSALRGLQESLATKLQTEIRYLNILGAIKFNKSNINEEMFQYINQCGPTCIGLAMRKMPQ